MFNFLAYISIGNSDNKLTQEEWSTFCEALRCTIKDEASEIHEVWYSASDSQYQNMCICAEFGDTRPVKRKLAKLAGSYRQESIAWAEAERTEFISGA